MCEQNGVRAGLSTFCFLCAKKHLPNHFPCGDFTLKKKSVNSYTTSIIQQSFLALLQRTTHKLLCDWQIHQLRYTGITLVEPFRCDICIFRYIQSSSCSSGISFTCRTESTYFCSILQQLFWRILFYLLYIICIWYKTE